MSDPGLYVFRFFFIDPASTDEIAALSKEAWTTFEGGGDYQTEPKALFKKAEPNPERDIMLLVTWYDGFGSWEASRRPPPEARQNFQRRRELTHGTVAFATRLATPGDRA